MSAEIRAILASFPSVYTVRFESAHSLSLDVYTTVSSPADEAEIAAAWLDVDLPLDLREVWKASREAFLYHDEGRAGYGMTLLSPQASRSETDRLARDYELDEDSFHPGDIAIGTFPGEPDRLIIGDTDRGITVIVATPIDSREDWSIVGNDIAEFLTRYRDQIHDQRWQIGIERAL